MEQSSDSRDGGYPYEGEMVRVPLRNETLEFSYNGAEICVTCKEAEGFTLPADNDKNILDLIIRGSLIDAHHVIAGYVSAYGSPGLVFDEVTSDYKVVYRLMWLIDDISNLPS